MQVGRPVGKAVHPSQDALVRGVEEVRPVAMHKHAVRVDLVVSVAGEVRTLVDDENVETGISQRARVDRSGETRANNQNLAHSNVHRTSSGQGYTSHKKLGDHLQKMFFGHFPQVLLSGEASL